MTKRPAAIEVIDLEADPPAAKTYPTKNPNRGIEPLDQDRKFILVGNTGPTGQSLELFELSGEGKVNSIAAWIGMSESKSVYRSPGISSGQLATIGVNSKVIEIRSQEDGAMVRTVPLPADFDPTKMVWRFSEELLTYLVGKSLKRFDWRQGVALPSIEDSDQYWRCDGPLTEVRSPSGENRRIVETHSGQIVGRLASKEGLYHFDRARALTSSPCYGWTITEFDLATGKISRQWRPFAYVIPSLLGWLSAYAAWCLAWMLTSARRRWQAWVDVLLIGGVPFGLLVFAPNSAVTR